MPRLAGRGLLQSDPFSTLQAAEACHGDAQAEQAWLTKLTWSRQHISWHAAEASMLYAYAPGL